MFRTISSRHPRDPDLADRAATQSILAAIRDGRLYDVMPYEFHEEVTSQVNGEKVALRDRRPSVQGNLCTRVVEESVSFLFGEGRFPAVKFDDDAQTKAMVALLADCRADEQMQFAAFLGSIGSACVFLDVIGDVLSLRPVDTMLLTPEFSRARPTELERLTELYKVRGMQLAAMGYPVGLDQAHVQFWWRRVWDAEGEWWFTPVPVVLESGEKSDPPSKVDQVRSVPHRLGFVPAVWIRNMAGGARGAPDGKCTFQGGIETSIEYDYQLSQGGRGLKYSSDPTLVLKDDGTDAPLGALMGSAGQGDIPRGAGHALVVTGDAKLLEINGQAARAVIDFAKFLREVAIEAMHGNVSSVERARTAMSGEAMKMHYASLVLLADRLRGPWGRGFLSICRMAARLSGVYTLRLEDGSTVPDMSAARRASLVWPPFFPPTVTDRQMEASTLGVAVDKGLMSRKTAVERTAQTWDVADANAELAEIAKDEAAAADKAVAIGAQVKASENVEE